MFVVSMESIRGITLPRKTIKMLVKKEHKVVSIGAYKMVMQTKRRELGLDCNSSRF